ncbi:MAG: hypothetical protein QXE05_04490 [Nitrososphaeria archaeon]
MTLKRLNFILIGGYSNVNGWHSKIILINKVNQHNRVFIKFYSDTDGKELILTYYAILNPSEIRGIELDFNQLKDRYGRIEIESDYMIDGNVMTKKDDNIIDLRLVRPDIRCC